MAFQYNAFGQKVASDPAAAHAQLVSLFKLHDRSTAAVAAELGANVVTLRRWIKRLAVQGFLDPGFGDRRVRGEGRKFRQKISADPIMAHVTLTALFERAQYNASAVAKQMKVTDKTLASWINKLRLQGFDDPAQPKRAKRGKSASSGVR